MDLMQIRRRELLQKTILPFGYRKVDWLQSSGTQYIDTGYKPTTNTTVDITFKYAGTTSEDRNLFGGRSVTNTQKNDFSIWTNTSSGKGIGIHYPLRPNGYGTDTGWVYTGDIQTAPVHLLITPQYVYVNGSKVYTFNVTRTQYTLEYSAWMFGARAAQSGPIKPLDAYTIYGLSLSEGTTMYRNFVPCVRLSDSKPGMYDTVNGVFYTNSGTGEFIIPS